MKKIYSTLCFVLLTGMVCFAQDFVKLGEISKEEAGLKQVPFDKEANAVILLHEAFSNHDDQYRLITYHHIRIKILNENGFNSANVSIPFYRKNNFEEIDKIEAVTVNIGPGGEMEKTKVDRKSIYTKETNERIGEIVFAFPAVKAGSILDYNYRSTMKHYGGLEEWYFQDILPVVSSKYLLTLLPNSEFAYQVSKRSDRHILIRPIPASGRIYFEMSDIPALVNEPYMDARKDYIQKVIFQLSGYNGSGFDKKEYMASWDAVNTELLSTDEFGDQLKKNIDATELIIKVQVLHPGEKMNAVYKYVRNNMNWNGLYSKFSAEGVKNAWKKKSGTSGDINLILVNLLNAVGLDAFPMLVSERFNGIVHTEYPFVEQFNSVFACVVINDKKYYLDATDKFTPVHITPSGILNTTAFIIKKKAGELIQVSNDSLLFREYITGTLEVMEDGSVKGDLDVKSEDYAKMEKLVKYERDRANFKNTFFHTDDFPREITSFELKNKDNDSLPLMQELKFNTALKTAGEYKYISLNFLPDFQKNPFLSDTRFSKVNFGYRKKISAVTLMKLPSAYSVDDIPKPVEMITPDRNFVFRRKIIHNKENNTITSMIDIEFKKSIYTVDEYYALKEVYGKMFGYLKEPVLLKKK